jgi:hypothetical protein
MKKVIIALMVACTLLAKGNYEASESKELPLLSEGFENVQFPPEGWSLVTVNGSGFIRSQDVTQGTVYEGRYVAVHLDESGDNNNWLITPKIALPAAGFCTFNFWQYGYWLNYVTSGYHQVAVSTDMSTWNVIYTGHPPVGPTGAGGVWEKIILSLDDYSGSEVYIGFRYVGNYEDQWYIDDVKVLYDDEGPQITGIKGNETLLPVIGAYLNNPLVLYVTASDSSGTGSVKGFYDIGGETGSVDFVQSKAVYSDWSGSIPAQSNTASGDIYFEMTDIGGMKTVTGYYDIEFVMDMNPPEVRSFSYGNPVLVNQEMNLELVFADESAISEVRGFYSEDDFLTWTEFDMTPAKIHLYTYTGTLPPKSEVTTAKVFFEITDVENNKSESSRYTVKWYNGDRVLFDNFDTGDSGFWDWTTPGTTWAITEEDSYTGSHSLTDSPGGNYADNSSNSIMTVPLDFSGYIAVEVYFWAKIDVEKDWDFFIIQATTSTEPVPVDGLWTTVFESSGDDLPWQSYRASLNQFAYSNNVRLRLKILSDNYVTQDGVYIDDFNVLGYYKEEDDLIVDYDGPAKITADSYTIPREFTIPVGTGDYISYVGLAHTSGFSGIKVIYSADGGPEQEYFSEVSSGPSGDYELRIPEQPAGTQVFFKIAFTVESDPPKQYESIEYMLRFGNFQYYQNGDEYIDFLNIIGTSEDASATHIAKRISMGPVKETKGHYKSDLVGITIENYISNTYPCDPMYVHVWADDNGQPGEDLIEPIYVETASTMDMPYELTYIDLRPYSDKLSGLEDDVFVGFESAGIATNVLYEVRCATDPDWIGFERSWLARNEYGHLSWTLEQNSVYHISAVVAEYEYLDGPLSPKGVTFEGEGNTVYIYWKKNDPAEGVVSYNIYKDTIQGFEPVTPLANVSNDSTAVFEDSDLHYPDPGKYYYKITAVDGEGYESSPSVEIVVSLLGIEDQNIPLVTGLYQNYPNPFNPETVIKYSLAHEAEVKLSVYDIAGREVAKLVSGRQIKGNHSVNFNAEDLTSGMYIYSLKVDGKAVQSRKLMVLK